MKNEINVQHWLTSNGFERFVDLFTENEIDAEVLVELNREDLRDLDLPLGVQKKMLKLIEQLQPDTAKVEQSALVGTSESGVAEYRQLTVMFCDLVGSTALSNTLDAEAFRELIVAYQAACNSVIQQHDGFVARLFGDGILVYFGYPRANENDAERAVHTAIELVGAMSSLRSDLGSKLNIELAIRIGIATGPTIVGDLMGEGVAQEAVALGDAPNLAARLQGLAGHNEIVIAPTTRRLLKGRFNFRDMGQFDIAGLVAPVNAWSVEQSRLVSRFEAAQSNVLAPLIGREEEFDMLSRRWRYALEGEGQVALITGEAGIGKSRLALALLDSLDPEQVRVLRYQCSPYQTSSALYPIVERIRQSADIEPADGSEAKICKLRGVVSTMTDKHDMALALLADLLSIPLGDDVPALQLTPQQKKEATFEVFKNQMFGLATDMPLLLLVEDVHWVDPTTLELLEYVVTLLKRHRILMVVTYRPGFQADWSGEANTTLFSLGKLRSNNSLELIGSLCDGKTLPDKVTRMIIEKTDGVPLFVEELTQTLLESGALTEHENRFTLDAPLPPSAIPDTLQDSLMARLDRLGDSKEVAQVAAVIGREFGQDLLQAVMPDVNLAKSFDRLQEAGLLFKQGTVTNPHYMFKHALIRDTAYESMLKSRRQTIHGQIAAVLADKFPERATLEPHLLAHHFTASDNLEMAVPNWIAAAKVAYGRFANLEAITHSENGIETLGKLPVTPERIGQQLQLQFLRGAAYRVTEGYASAVAEESFRDAMKLALKLNLIDHYADANRGLFAAFYVSGRLQESRELGEELRQAAQTPMQEMQALYMIGSIDFWFGDLKQSREALERSLSLYDDSALTGLALQLDPGVMARIYHGLTMAHLGFVEEAERQSIEAVRTCEGLDQPLTLGQTLLFSAMTSYHCEQDFMPVVTKLQALSLEHKIPFQKAAVDVFCGLEQIYKGNAREGLALSTRGYELYRSLGVTSGFTMTLCILARGCLALGEADDALEWLEKAKIIVRDTGELVNESELYLLQGQAFLIKEATELAESSFKQALDIARQTSSPLRLHELRSATELASLWLQQNKRKVALDLLQPVHNWFGNNVNRPSLKRSAQVLEQLNS
ncbi:MAG: AAA family ATPase [Gammaproteobacteria bacterium]